MRINDKLKNLLNRARLPRSLESVRFGDLLAGIDHDATVALEGTTTDISEATDGYFATPAEIGLAVMEEAQYSRTPQKIGTWIDGTPVWRVAFAHQLTETDVGDKTVDILGDYITDDAAAEFNSLIVGGFATLNKYQTPSVLDSAICHVGERYVDFDGEHDTTYGIFGYIEFVTPQENIKTGDGA